MDYYQQVVSSIKDNSTSNLSFLNAVVSTSQINIEKNQLMIFAPSYVLEKFATLIQKSYPTVEFHSWDNFLLINRNINEFLNTIGYLDNLSFVENLDKVTILKTYFLMFGRFYYNKDNTQNSKGYNLEFVVKSEQIANFIISFLNDNDLNLKKIKRQSYFVVYTKNSSTISDLFVLIGATYTALEIQNDLTIREMRNHANRQNNCFESNLEKTLDASALQLEAINYIINHFSIDYLSENLREVALARLANPDISLNELKLLLGNKISRAGIKYRLDKIIEIYQKIKSEH